MKTINDKKITFAPPAIAEELDVKPTSLGFKIAVFALSVVLVGGFVLTTIASRKRSDEIPPKRSAATVLEPLPPLDEKRPAPPDDSDASFRIIDTVGTRDQKSDTTYIPRAD